MFRLYSCYLLSLILLLSLSRPSFSARILQPDPPVPTAVTAISTWQNFTRLLDAAKGSQVTGISELKKYFNRFGYLPEPPLNGFFNDSFDAELESAVASYQTNLGLPVTGNLDTDTITTIVSPRCGVRDTVHHEENRSSSSSSSFHMTGRFAYFSGKPRWSRHSPVLLSYAFSPKNTIDYIDKDEIKAVFRRAFSRWSAVIPVSFAEAEEYSSADIRIAFYRGDHGDGEPFDGVLGVLAHAFSPESGRFHLDAAEKWAVDFSKEKSKAAVDLESVATHEIGHVLGLAHSAVKEAVMYPSLRPRTRRVDLRVDDVEGVQALYGSNPNFRYSSLLESEDSSDAGFGLVSAGLSSPLWTASFVAFFAHLVLALSDTFPVGILFLI